MGDRVGGASAVTSRFATMAVAIAFELSADPEAIAEIKRCAEAAGRNEPVPWDSAMWQRIEPVVTAWNRIWSECVETGTDDFVVAKEEIPKLCLDTEVVRAFLKVQPLIQPLAH